MASLQTPLSGRRDDAGGSVQSGGDAAGPATAAPGETAAAARSADQRKSWLASLAVYALAVSLLGWAFLGEIAAAVTQWTTNPTFGYAFLILPISGYLLYRLRSRLAGMAPRAAPLALVLIAVLSLVWALGDLANVMVVKQLVFVGLCQSLFLLVFGWRITWTALFPLGYLYLAVPLGSEVIPYLQDITAQIVVHLLRLTGMPVFLDGYYIQIPSGHFLVAEACSGLRFLIVCIALGLLIAYLFFRSWPRRILFIGLSVIVPVVANGLRAYGIIILAHVSDYRIAADVDHIVYGFVFLSFVIVILIGLATFLREKADRPGAAASAPVATGPATAAGARRRLVAQASLATLAVAVVFLTQGWTAVAKAPPQDTSTANLLAPDLAPEWSLEPAATPAWEAPFHAADARLFQSYSRGEDRVDLQVGYYVYQREGAEALSELNVLMERDTGWQIVSQQPMRHAVGEISVPLVEMVLSAGGQTRLVWYWYRIDGEFTNSRILGKLLEMKAMALGGDRAAAMIAVSADVHGSRQEAAAVLRHFLRQSLSKDAPFVQVERASGSAPQESRSLPPGSPLPDLSQNGT